MRQGLRNSRWPLVAGAAALTAVGIWLHLRAGYTLPRPWPDESHFLTPAITLARSGRLAAPELNAPSGIFWMPSGYYLLTAPLVAVGIDPLAGARWLSLVGVLVFVGGTAMAALRFGTNRLLVLVAALVWLCTPRVVAMGNIARMEAVVLGLAGVCLWLVSRGRWRLAVPVSLLATVVHPVGVIVAIAVCSAAVARLRVTSDVPGPWRRAEKIALGLAGAIVVAQIVYFALNAEAATAHLQFQLTRKAGRSIAPGWHQWLLVLATAVGLAAIAWWRQATTRKATAWVAVALVGGFTVVDAVGREVWYRPLGGETVVLLLVLGAGAGIARSRAAGSPAFAIAVAAVGVALFAGILVPQWQRIGASNAAVANGNAAYGCGGGTVESGLALNPGAVSRSEWTSFNVRALAALRRLDAAAKRPAVVMVDPLSGFGQELFAANWRRLRFVQPTPATPLASAEADYLLVTPGAPFTTRALVRQWPGERALNVRSADRTFCVRVLQKRAS